MLNNLQHIDISEFLGPWQTVDRPAIPQGRSIVAQNVEYIPGSVKTRFGYGPVTTLTSLGDIIASMEWWQSPGNGTPVDYLAYLAKATSANPGINIVNISTGAKTHLYTPAGSPVGAVFAPVGPRLYSATYNANGFATDNPRVYSDYFGGPDQLFQSPMVSGPSVVFSDGGASAAIGITPGAHNFGFLLQTRNGYTGAPSPVNGSGAFTPISYTQVASGRALHLAVTGAWPTAVQGIQVLMTTVANPFQYYIVPGVSVAVPGGSTFTVNFQIDIDDGTLAATATDATPYFDLFTGNLAVSFLQEYNNRMCYIALDGAGTPTIFYSDPNNYQAISLSRSVVYLPGTKSATSAFSLYGNSYILGPHWTYYTSDDGGDPVTWHAPQLVDSQIGTLSPNGCTVNSAQGIAWVVDVNGLYVFQGGAYADRPVSYYQKIDWMRINWAAAGTIRVIAPKDTYRVHVLVPLDGASSPNYVMTWDYVRGLSPEQVNYSLDNFQAFNPGAIAIVENPTNKLTEVWLGPTIAAQPVVRQQGANDANPYRDNGTYINSTYQTALLPHLSPNLMKHQAMHLKATGSGPLFLAVQAYDGSRSVNPTTITLGGPTPMYIRRYSLNSEAATIIFTSSNQLDGWFQISALTHYYSLWVMNR